MKIREHEFEEEEQRDFLHEIALIAKVLNIHPSRIEIDGNHPVGDDCIFIDGEYNGYLDKSFYDWIVDGYDPYGEFEAWKERWRKRNETQTKTA